ncbi:MAG: hypothetical protein GY874_20065 [Desulfobacteraceae bacterium]|nr:hypothetical protein [Desulfobacteraceae bacterium]
MKQKYVIIRDEDQNKIIIREYAELDKEMMSLLCEETYDVDVIEKATREGAAQVINALRTNNMYPPSIFAEPISETILGLFEEGGDLSAELFLDDRELFAKEVEVEVEVEVEASDEEETSEKDVEVDDLLEDDLDDDFNNGEEVMKDIKSSIPASDDSTGKSDDAS